jgi:hypothetical protein
MGALLTVAYTVRPAVHRSLLPPRGGVLGPHQYVVPIGEEGPNRPHKHDCGAGLRMELVAGDLRPQIRLVGDYRIGRTRRFSTTAHQNRRIHTDLM